MSISGSCVRSARATDRRAPFRGTIRHAALAAAALALASCWHPAFDPAISGSEAVIRKLGAPVFFFTSEEANGYKIEDAWFLPNAGNPVTTGVLFRRDAFRIWAVSGTSYAEAVNVFGDHYTAYASPELFSISAFLASEPTTGRSISPMNAFPSFLPTAPYPPNISATFGIGFTRVPLLHQARSTWIGYDTSFIPVYGTSLWDAGLSPPFGATLPLAFPDHTRVNQPGTAFQTLGYVYLSCGLADGSRAIFRWVNPPSALPPVRYPEVHGPLVGALSDDRLLAEEDGILSVLNQNLERIFSFPAGKLRFVHERWDGIQMISVFSRTIFVGTGDEDNGRLKIEVYEIPTADLYKLAD
jgi:hypothetical protein